MKRLAAKEEKIAAWKLAEALQIRETILMVAGLIRESSLPMRWSSNKWGEAAKQGLCFVMEAIMVSFWGCFDVCTIIPELIFESSGLSFHEQKNERFVNHLPYITLISLIFDNHTNILIYSDLRFRGHTNLSCKE